MKAATQWFKFDPAFVGTPMQSEWCLWSFITKHGRETYSGRWIVSDGADLIVTDRGWSVPLVVGEAYFARVIPFEV